MKHFQIEQFINSGFIFQLSQDEICLGWGKRTCLSKSVSPGLDKTQLLTPNFFSDGATSFLEWERTCLVSKDECLQLFSAYKDSNVKIEFGDLDKNTFVEDFAEIQEGIQEGIIDKAVPVTFAQSSIHGIDQVQEKIPQMVCNVLKKSSNLYAYGEWDGANGIFGATPEVLFSIDHFEDERKDRLETMALAGTRQLGNTDSDYLSLLEDPKEMKEHQLVVEDIYRQLQAFGEVQVGQTEELKLSTLKHLKTEIFVDLEDGILQKEKGVDLILKALHPTPALGVSPRTKKGIELLKSLSYNNERQRFGAPIMLRTSSRTLCLVAIRNIQWEKKDSSAFLGAGCGIVKESQLEREWNEVNLKKQFVLKTLGLL